MKKILLIFPLLLTMLACDNIGEDDRYIEVAPIKSERRVLLEEFTGQRCTNCPAAHAIIEKLEEQYGEDLIVVSIHAGSFGIAAPDGLMQAEGNVYAERWGITAYPCGVVDRNSGVLTDGEWATAIRNDISKETNVDIALEAEAKDGSINVSTRLSSSANVAASLQLWVTEDSIVGFQIDGGTRLQEYVHNNVFRACVNGTWGQPVAIEANVYASSDNSIAIDETWNVDNLNIVGFIYDDKGVVQVAKCKVKNNQ